jgi:hypothetical protein
LWWKAFFVHKEGAEGDSATNEQRATSNEQLFPAHRDGTWNPEPGRAGKRLLTAKEAKERKEVVR